jgi:hypothetical protein
LWHIPGKDGDWSEWEDFVHETVMTCLQGRDHTTTDNVFFGVWNEPQGDFWPFPEPYTYPGHYLETWKHAYNKIKAVNFNAKVVGPSVSNDITHHIIDIFLPYAKNPTVIKPY